MDMHRRAVATLVAVACAMIGSGAVAVAALAGGNSAPAADQNGPQPTAPEPSVVIERLFDDTYVVVGTTPSSVVTTSRPKASSASPPCACKPSIKSAQPRKPSASRSAVSSSRPRRAPKATSSFYFGCRRTRTPDLLNWVYEGVSRRR